MSINFVILLKRVATLLTFIAFTGCAGVMPQQAKQTVTEAKHIALINLTARSTLLMGEGPITPHSASVITGATFTGALGGGLLAEVTRQREITIALEFSARAPQGFAAQLQNQLTQSAQAFFRDGGKTVTVIDVELPKMYGRKDIEEGVSRTVRDKCATCDTAVLLKTEFGYGWGRARGAGVLRPISMSNIVVLNPVQGKIISEAYEIVHREPENDVVGANDYDFYPDLRDSKRDVLTPLTTLPKATAKRIVNMLSGKT